MHHLKLRNVHFVVSKRYVSSVIEEKIFVVTKMLFRFYTFNHHYVHVLL